MTFASTLESSFKRTNRGGSHSQDPFVLENLLLSPCISFSHLRDAPEGKVEEVNDQFVRACFFIFFFFLASNEYVILITFFFFFRHT